MDLFTRFVELKLLKKADSKSVAQALEEFVIFCRDTPDFLLTDNGTEFVNRDRKHALEDYSI